MRIGIDISQTAYKNTGVANYLTNLVEQLIELDDKNDYVLFYSSLRKPIQNSKFKSQNLSSNVKIKTFKFPPSFLDLLWNKMHVMPIETFIGKVDLFITSDWTEPPSRAKKATIIYDMIVYKSPNETAKMIVETQRRKLEWVKKESDIIFAISKSGKRDIEDILGISSDKIKVIYPGME